MNNDNTSKVQLKNKTKKNKTKIKKKIILIIKSQHTTNTQ